MRPSKRRAINVASGGQAKTEKKTGNRAVRVEHVRAEGKAGPGAEDSGVEAL